MANYDELKYSGITGSTTLATTVETTVASTTGTSTFTASGAIAVGDIIMMKTDGTVEAITEASAEEIPKGTAAEISTLSTSKFPAAAFDPANPNNLVIMPGDGTVMAITIDNDGVVTATGTPVDAQITGDRYGEVKFDPHNAGRFIVISSDNSSSSATSQMKLFSLSGLTITMGTYNASLYSMESDSPSIDWDPFVANRLYGCATLWSGTSNYGSTASVVTLSDNTVNASISVGSRYKPNGYVSGSGGNSLTACPVVQNRLYYCQQDGGGGYDPQMWVATASGTAISFVSQAELTTVGGSNSRSNGTRQYRVLIDEDNSTAVSTKGVVIYNASSSVYARSFTVSATNAISMGAQYTIAAAGVTWNIDAAINPSNTSEFAVVASGYNVDANIVYGSFDGTTVTVNTSYTYSAGANYPRAGAMAFRPGTSKFTAVYGQNDSKYYTIGGVLPFGVANFDSTRVFGIANAAAADTESVSVLMTGGVYDGFTGLIPGKTYYVDNGSNLTQTSTDNAMIGKAISTTAIQVQV